MASWVMGIDGGGTGCRAVLADVAGRVIGRADGGPANVMSDRDEAVRTILGVTQAALADMATEVDAAALLVYRAAWAKDSGAERVTREASMAKLYATEAAQRVVDRAVQIHGGLGVTKGNKVEELYREVRALRIYEGASEVQRVVIARQVLGARN